MLSLQYRPLSLLQPHLERPLFLHQIAAARFDRDGLSNKKEDLDEVIHLLIEDTSLPLVQPTENEIRTLLELSLALLLRLEKFGSGELEDVNSAITYLRELHDCPLENFGVPHHAVTTSLVEMLATRVKGDASDALEDINKILNFCRELTSGTSPHSLGYLTSALKALTQAVLDTYSRGKQMQSLDQVVVCLREALKSCSGLHQVMLDLAKLLAVRFFVRHIDNDYEEAKVLLDRIIACCSPEDVSSRCQANALKVALGHARSITNSNPEVSESAVSKCRSFLDQISSFGNPLHPVIIELLKSHVERGSNHIGPPQSAQAVHLENAQLPVDTFGGVNVSDIVPAPLPASLEEKISHLRDHYPTARQGTEDQRSTLKSLVQLYNIKIYQTRETAFIDEAVKYNKKLLATTHPTDQAQFFYISSFGNFLRTAFSRTENNKYLDESIDNYREGLRLDSSREIHHVIIQRLIESLSIRWDMDGCQDDLDEVMRLYASYVNDTYAMVPNRFESAFHWTSTARVTGHHSLSDAYESVMALMQSSLVFAPTLPIQHDRLVEKRDLYEKTPLNFASHLIRANRLERAIEALEQGRALLWSEMRGLRTSSDRLRAKNPDLAKRFTAINQELEMLTTSALSSGSTEKDDEESTRQFSVLMKRQCHLLKERNAVISTIKNLEGLGNFLSPHPFDTLHHAALHGPVIIINNCELGSDIIVVLHNSPPSRIETPPDFFDRANQLKGRLSSTRKDPGLNSKQHEDALSYVLTELFKLVGRSVIKRLEELRIPEQSRVWWCSTSVFLDLPLHAMGPIPSSGGVTRYFSDLYISSYTQTLSALITSRRPSTHTTQTHPKPTLVVAQPGQSPPGSWPDTLAIRGLDLQTKAITSGSMSPTTVLDSLERHQFAHIPHHVTLKPEKPFDAAMLFHNEKRLNLLDIVRSRFPAGEFAFLPGSHTAELTGDSIPDEVLHFSAAVQYAGIRSVIGTMWEADDEDGRNLAEIVYRRMFSEQKGVEPYYEKSAKALQYAVQQLRPALPLVRWVNFVHHGA